MDRIWAYLTNPEHAEGTASIAPRFIFAAANFSSANHEENGRELKLQRNVRRGKF